MKSFKEINKLIKQYKKELNQKYKVKKIGIFGSYVRGEQKKRSDIDILIDFEEIPDLLKFIEIENYFENILKIKVDLVRKQAIKPELKDIILKEVIYL